MAMSPFCSSVSCAIFFPVMTTPLVLPRSAITTAFSLSFTTAWKRLTLLSLSTRSLAFPRPMVMTGLFNSRMPFLPSGDEMISRDIERSLFLQNFVHVLQLAQLNPDGAMDGFIAFFLQHDFIGARIYRPMNIRLFRGHLAVHRDGSPFGKRADVNQSLAFR